MRDKEGRVLVNAHVLGKRTRWHHIWKQILIEKLFDDRFPEENQQATVPWDQASIRF